MKRKREKEMGQKRRERGKMKKNGKVAYEF